MLTSTTHPRADAAVIRLSGVLDARTYQQARDSVVKVAIDQSTAVIVDVNDLEVWARIGSGDTFAGITGVVH
jgi:anti-anti-sigma regulatory factor